MPEEKKEEGLRGSKEFGEFVKDSKKKEGTDQKSLIHQIATREKLERDYEEDVLSVTFFSSPETKRMIKAKRPTQKEMMMIMRLSAEAAIYEGKMDEKSLQRMTDIYDQLPKLAADLTTDKKLNAEFFGRIFCFSYCFSRPSRQQPRQTKRNWEKARSTTAPNCCGQLKTPCFRNPPALRN